MCHLSFVIEVVVFAKLSGKVKWDLQSQVGFAKSSGIMQLKSDYANWSDANWRGIMQFEEGLCKLKRVYANRSDYANWRGIMQFEMDLCNLKWDYANWSGDYAN